MPPKTSVKIGHTLDLIVIGRCIVASRAEKRRKSVAPGTDGS
jgi:hypothetical protein